VWVQVVASTYGYGFPECPVGTGDQKAFSRAAAGARVADVVAQIDAVVAAGGFRDKDLVLIMAGMNDILELYGRYPRESRETLLAAARARGITVGLQVDRMVALGAKVIVSTVPDLGLSPFARAEDAAFPKGGRSQLLADLTAELNGRIRVTIINDGRFVGLVLADEFVQTAVASPGSYSLSNARDEACLAAVPPPDCSTLTLKAGANAETWLWADGYRLSTAGHRQIGGQAEVRARNNPF
jgi:phospholipase/lecithinase/hemolysin